MDIDIENRFAYHKPDDEKIVLHEQVRENCKQLAQWLNSTLPAGREKSRAMTALEDVMFNANAAIARTPTRDLPTVTSITDDE